MSKSNAISVYYKIKDDTYYYSLDNENYFESTAFDLNGMVRECLCTTGYVEEPSRVKSARK